MSKNRSKPRKARQPASQRSSGRRCPPGSRERDPHDSRDLGQIIYGPPLGDGVVQAPLEEVLAALEAQHDLDWENVAPLVVPVVPRFRPYPPGTPRPLITVLPPGVAIGFGIDVGPAFLSVSSELAASWQIAVADLAARAVGNVHERAAEVDASEIHHGELDGMPTQWLQTGRSIGSTLILAPDQVRRIFGPEPRIFITPMRDLIIGVPWDADPDVALWIHAEIASLDPNCLGPTAYRFDGSAIMPTQLELDQGVPGVDRRMLIA